MSPTELGSYYDGLSRFLRAARWVSRSSDASLTVHRLLIPDQQDVAPHDAVHARLLRALGPLDAPRVIDAGCGLGGTAFYLHARLGGLYDGITLSAEQRDRADKAAHKRGVANACRFHVRSYDHDLSNLVGEGADLVVAIESLAHSPDPANTIRNLAGTLRRGGRLAVIDDVPGEDLPDEDADFRAFRSGWRCEDIARLSELKAAIGAAGLELERDEDLTPRVIMRNPTRRERLARVNRRVRALLGTSALAEVVDSLHGGLMLERLYARRLMQYRMLVARR